MAQSSASLHHSLPLSYSSKRLCFLSLFFMPSSHRCDSVKMSDQAHCSCISAVMQRSLLCHFCREGDNLIFSRRHCGYPGIFKHTLFRCAVVVCLMDFPRLWRGHSLVCNGVIAAVLSLSQHAHPEYREQVPRWVQNEEKKGKPG